MSANTPQTVELWPVYPQWICQSCGERFGRRKVGLATWHSNECDICGLTKTVTAPRDFGHLVDGWKLLALLSLATDVVRASARGDQQFISCLRGDEEETVKLRLAIVSLGEALRRTT